MCFSSRYIGTTDNLWMLILGQPLHSTLHVDKLEWNWNVGAAQHLNDRLKVVNLLTCHSDLILLDSRLDL